MKLKAFILVFGISILISKLPGASSQAKRVKVDFPNGLENDDIIRWKGTTGKTKLIAVMVIRPASTRAKSFRLEIQAFRKRLMVRTQPTRLPMSYRKCFLGSALLRLNVDFDIMVRVGRLMYKVYVNKKLVFSLPNATPPQDVRYAQVFGSATTEYIRKLEIPDYAEMLNEQNCGQHSASEISQSDIITECNKNDPTKAKHDRIVNGKIAEAGTLPWQLSIRDERSDHKHFCGATLISRCWAVSAGHCFPVINSATLRKYKLRAGDFFNDDDNEANDDFFSRIESQQDLKIERIYRHELYVNSPTDRNDIALIKLKDCVDYDNHVKPVCLPTTNEEIYYRKTCSASGWGATEWGQLPSQYPKCLRIGDVTIKKPSECSETFKTRSYLRKIMMCASGDSSEQSVDACQGDSGGPLICHLGANATLVGVVSWGIGCGDLQYPGVYTRVAPFLKWIFSKTQLSPNDEDMRRLVGNKKVNDPYCHKYKN